MVTSLSQLTPIGELFRDAKSNRLMVRCLCTCGNETIIRHKHFLDARAKSCGCLRKIKAAQNGRATATHGKTHGPEWKSYYAMLDRCYKPEHKYFAYYGGRGIKVCERWLMGFENFYADMGPRPEGMTLDRKETDGDYTPDNCQWATHKEQNNNRRTNVYLDAFGKRLTISQWAEKMGIDDGTIQGRIKKGWTAEAALTSPLTPRTQRYLGATK